jgi:hypothetical protein
MFQAYCDTVDTIHAGQTAAAEALRDVLSDVIEADQ